MLQEATRAINSAFNNSFIKKLSQYLHDCVREEVKSSTFRNLKADRDNKWIFLDQEDTLFTQGLEYLRLEGSDSKLTESEMYTFLYEDLWNIKNRLLAFLVMKSENNE